MFDKRKRPYHAQIYANSGVNVHGAHLDTFEVDFHHAVEEQRRGDVETIVKEFAGETKGLGWPMADLLSVEVTEGYYNVDELQKRLEKSHFKVAEVRHYFTARLDEKKHVPRFDQPFDPDTRRPPGIRF
jgi:hypothetical protein